ncbi:MAG: CpaE family protein, partial [Acidimicrobiia bacterium]
MTTHDTTETEHPESLVNPSASVAIAVVDEDQAVRSRIALQLDRPAEPIGSFEALAERLDGSSLVLVIGPSLATPAGLSRLEPLLESRPELGAVLVVGELSTEVLQLALRAGVRDVLTDPVDSGQLTAAVDRIAGSLAPVVPSRMDVLGSLGAPQAPEAERGQVLTVFSTKGGAGKSVIAVNLAIALARRSEGPVVLVDADLQFGDLAVMLKLAPQHTIVDAVGSMDRLDATLLQQLLVKHEPSGIYVLAAPVEPSFADQVSAGEMVKIIEMIRGFAAHVVIDTPAYFNEVVLAIIEESDDVVLVAGMDIPNIKNVKIGLQTLRLLNVPSHKLHLVLNRANSKVKLDVG